MRKRIRRAVTVLLCAALLLGAVPAEAAVKRYSNSGFPDVEGGSWYDEAITFFVSYPEWYSGVIDGYPNGTFGPYDNVKRGEFLKMLMTLAMGYTADKSRNGIHWAGEYYTMALENNILIANPYAGSDPIFPCTFDALEQKITRYEMAVILSNTCANMLREGTVVASRAYEHIPDYSSIGADYVNAVEQAYGKGLLVGYDDGSFCGDDLLTRAQAAVVLYRVERSDIRVKPDWVGASTAVSAATGFTGRSGKQYKSFAFWLQAEGSDSYGNLNNEAKEYLFGYGTAAYYRGYFASAEEAAPYMTAVSIPFWVINAYGAKEASAGYITVNKMVAAEVQAIFTQIFNSEEKFPIYGHSIGGARFSDALRHSWGCAIDVNPLYNCECNFKNANGTQKLTCGYGWWPASSSVQTWVNRAGSAYHGQLTEPSVYSIAPGSSVVQAFANYGWGWGGSGNNDPSKTPNGWGHGNSFDFMHFSVLSSGG